jgi:hypothetical protein
LRTVFSRRRLWFSSGDIPLFLRLPRSSLLGNLERIKAWKRAGALQAPTLLVNGYTSYLFGVVTKWQALAPPIRTFLSYPRSINFDLRFTKGEDIYGKTVI